VQALDEAGMEKIVGRGSEADFTVIKFVVLSEV